MQISRYSAAEQHGIAIDRIEDYETPQSMVALMREHGAEENEVAALVDITPDYVAGLAMRYFVSRPSLDGPVVVELVPHRADATNENLLLVGYSDGSEQSQEIDMTPRSITIPKDALSYALITRDPGSTDRLSLHEFIVHGDVIEQ